MQEAADGSTEAVEGLSSKMQEDFSKIGVNIVDQNGNLRSTYDILTDIGNKWPYLTAEQKTYYSELAAGKNQANIFAALMQNIGTAVDATTTALNSNGSAAEENAKRMDSVQGKIEQFKAAWEKLTTSIISSDALKSVIEFGTNVINFIQTPVGEATVKIIAFSTAIGKLVSIFSKFSGTTKVIKSIFGVFGKSSSIADAAGNLTRMASGLEAITGKATTASKAMGGIGSALSKLGGSSVLGPLGLLAGGIMTVVAATKAYYKQMNENAETARNTAIESLGEYEKQRQKVSELESELSTVNQRIAEIQQKGKLSFTDQAELQSLQKQREELERTIELEKDKEELLAAKAKRDTVNSLNSDVHLESTGETVKQYEAVAKLRDEYTSLYNQYNQLTEAQKENGQGDILLKRMDKVGTELSDYQADFLELANSITGTDKESVELKQHLIDMANSAGKALDNTMKSTGQLEQAVENMPNAFVKMSDGSEMSFKKLSKGLVDLSNNFQTGRITATEYADEVSKGFDGINADKAVEAFSVTQEQLDSMSSEQQQEVLAMQSTWLAYGDNVAEALSSLYEEFDAGAPGADAQLQQIQDLQSQYLEFYTVANGLHQDESGNWVNEKNEVDQVAQSLQSAKDETNNWAAAVDGLSASQSFLDQVSKDTAAGVVNDSYWASQESTAAYQQTYDNFNSSMQGLFQTNKSAWQGIAQTVADTMGVDVTSIFDMTTGQLVTGTEGTSQAVVAGFQMMAQLSNAAIGEVGKASNDSFGQMQQKSQDAFNAVLSGQSAFNTLRSTATSDIQAVNTELDNLSSKMDAINGKEVKTTITTVNKQVFETEIKLPSVHQAKGTDFLDEDSMVTVGESGRETLVLPRGTSVMTASETRNLNRKRRAAARAYNPNDNYKGLNTGNLVTDVSIDRSTTRGFERAVKSMVSVVKDLNKSISSLSSQDTKKSTYSSASSTAAPKARAASYDDPHKEAFDAAYDEIKYLRDMDRISEEDYYNRLENLYKSYFAGRSEYLEEYRQYEVTVNHSDVGDDFLRF